MNKFYSALFLLSIVISTQVSAGFVEVDGQYLAETTLKIAN